MLGLDKNGNDVIVLSDPKEIAAEMNRQAIQYGLPLDYPYYLLSEENTKSIISNVPKPIYKELKLREYIPPKRINKNTKELMDYLLESIDLLHNSDPVGQSQFADGKGFQLNQCHHNSSSLFKLVYYLKNRDYISSNTKIKIVLGYISRKVPFRSLIGSLGIENDSLWVHEWHIWNYVNSILIDMTLFFHGNILPPESEIACWGKAEDHIVIFPPQSIEYRGCVFSDFNNFNRIVERIIGFR